MKRTFLGEVVTWYRVPAYATTVGEVEELPGVTHESRTCVTVQQFLNGSFRRRRIFKASGGEHLFRTKDAALEFLAKSLQERADALATTWRALDDAAQEVKAEIGRRNAGNTQ